MYIARISRTQSDAAASAVVQHQTSLHVAVVMFAGYVLLSRVEPDLRYTRYVLPIALAILWLARRAYGDATKLFTPPLSTFAAMVIAVCGSSAVVIGMTSTYYARFFEEALFLAAPLGAAIICASLKRHDGDGPMYALLAILMIDYMWEIGLSTVVFVSSNLGAFTADLMQSNAPTESIRAFSFGVLAVFFLVRRRINAAVLSILLTLLAGKRIVLVGLLAAAPLAIVSPSLLTRKRRALVAVVAIALNVATALSLRNLDNWGISERIQEVTLQSADAVLMGRQRLFALVADRLPDSPFLGAGLGRITSILESESAWLTNTHSDLLKYYMELGPAIFACWIGCFYWASRAKGALALVVFMNVLFLSDNVSIYFDVMFPFYLALAYLHHDVEPRRQPGSELQRHRVCSHPEPAGA